MIDEPDAPVVELLQRRPELVEVGIGGHIAAAVLDLA